jgi:hypothetical protein
MGKRGQGSKATYGSEKTGIVSIELPVELAGFIFLYYEKCNVYNVKVAFKKSEV